jgi:hypothetical protein
MSKLQFFSDKDVITCLPVLLADTLRKLGIIAPDHSRVQFCGFVSWSDGTAVFLPVNCREMNFDAVTAHFLLKALQRYYDDKATGVREGLGDEVIGATSLSLVLSLVDDYLVNGLYVRRAREYKLNSGKINWTRTISRRVGFPSNNMPVYLDLETSRTHYVSDCETARIHASVIRDIHSEYGELLFGGAQASDVNLELMPPPSGELTAQLAYLDRELSLSYSDRDMNLINSLRRYLERSVGKDDSLLVGTRNFHHVWEAMIDRCLPRGISVNSQLPAPFYFYNENYIPVSQKGQRTDTVIKNKDGNHIAVVDSKYYRAQDPQSAPGWPDIVKQIFYKTAVESVVPETTNVSLHFVFPGYKQALDSAHVGLRTNGPVKIKPAGDYPDIHCHYCDPVKLMEDYVNGTKDYALCERLLSVC